MGQIILFAGAFVVLVVLIYLALSSRYRDRRRETPQRLLEEEAGSASVESLIDRPPAAQRASQPNGVEPPFSEDDIQRAELGPRGVKGAPDPAKMTPQRAKKTPSHIDQGHVS